MHACAPVCWCASNAFKLFSIRIGPSPEMPWKNISPRLACDCRLFVTQRPNYNYSRRSYYAHITASTLETRSERITMDVRVCMCVCVFSVYRTVCCAHSPRFSFIHFSFIVCPNYTVQLFENTIEKQTQTVYVCVCWNQNSVRMKLKIRSFESVLSAIFFFLISCRRKLIIHSTHHSFQIFRSNDSRMTPNI